MVRLLENKGTRTVRGLILGGEVFASFNDSERIATEKLQQRDGQNKELPQMLHYIPRV